MNKNQLITFGIVVLVTASLTVVVFADNIGNSSKSILSTKTAVTDNLPVSQEVFQLSFKDYETENNVVELYKSSIKEIVAERQLSGSTFFTFIKTDDLENLHTGVKIDDRLFDLGKTSMMGRSNDLIQICEAEVLGTKYVKVTGILGANYAQSSYFLVGKKLPSLFLRVNATAIEIDIDGDGVKEIVSSYGTASCTDIYKFNEDKVKVANINETLNAQAVFLSDNKLFETYFKGKPNQPTFFQLTKEGILKKVSNSQSIGAGRMSPYSPYGDNITISSVPNIPSVQRQVKGILNAFSFAENYHNVPPPPVGDWRPQTTRIYLTDEETRKITEYGIPYGEAADKDENGRVYAIIPNELPKGLSEWLHKYNMKIPFVNVPDLKTYEETVLNPIYLKSKWWLELKGEIEINLQSYEKWFFNGKVPAGNNIIYIESPNNFVYNKPIIKNEPVIENKQAQDPYPVIQQDAPDEIVQKAKGFLVNKYGIPAEKIHLQYALRHTFELTEVDLWIVKFYQIPGVGIQGGITVYINKEDKSLTDVVSEGWTPFYTAEQKAEEKLCTKVEKHLYIKRRDMKNNETVKIEIYFQQAQYSAVTKALSDKIYERDREIYDEILKKYPDMKLIEGRPVDNQSGKYFYFFEEELRDARKELDSDRAVLYELQKKDISNAAQPLIHRLEEIGIKSVNYVDGSHYITADVTKEQINKLEPLNNITLMDIPHYSYDLIEK